MKPTPCAVCGRGKSAGAQLWTRVMGWMVLLLFASCSATMRASSLTRDLPINYLPSVPLQVAIEVNPDPEVVVYAVEDAGPSGWLVEGISDGGFRDPVSGKVKWGPFFDSVPRRLSYQVRPVAPFLRDLKWTGSAAFDGEVVATGGLDSVALPPSTLLRKLPLFYRSNVPFEIALEVTPDPTILVHTVEEGVPSGWTVESISAGGVFDSITRKLKWGPFFDGQARRLTYNLRSAPGELGSFGLSGRGWFDDVERPVEGDSLLQPEANTITRSLPSHYTPGVSFVVTNTVVLAGWVVVYAIEDGLPAGWAVSEISEGGVFDAVSGRVKWGPLNDLRPRTFSYRVTPTSGAGQFDGRGRFNNVEVPISGADRLTPFESRITRSMPGLFQAGLAFAVTNRAEPAPGVNVYAVEETIQFGWTIARIDQGGVLDAVNGKLKWGPFTDGASRDLVYVMIPPPGLVDPVPFTGGGRFDQEDVVTTGAVESRPALSTLSRQLPDTTPPGSSVAVVVRVAPTPDTLSYGVEERVPEGWTVTSIGDQGVLDVQLQRIKWGVFLDNLPRELHYSVAPPTGRGEVKGIFQGKAAFNGKEVTTTGDTVTRVQEGNTTVTVKLRIQQISTTQVQVEVDGDPGTSYSIEATTDLVNWAPWKRGVADGSGFLRVVDEATLLARFYRVR